MTEDVSSVENPRAPSSALQPEVTLVTTAESVSLLHEPAAQSPVNQVFIGVTMDVFDEEMNNEIRAEGSKQSAAALLAARLVKAVVHSVVSLFEQ